MRVLLPRGGTLSPPELAARQRVVTWVLVLHAGAVVVFGASRGTPLGMSVSAAVVVLLFALFGAQPHLLTPRARSGVSAVGLLVCSALLVQMSGGSIEMHFHFFVMVALIALFQDWLPFLLAIGFVGLHHGGVGVLAPQHVYDHGAAWSSPWRWAAIHAAFVLAASAAQVASWRMVEDEHDRSQESLRARERRFRSLIEHSVDAVCILGPDHEIRYESASAERVLGFPAGSRDGQSSFAFAHPDDAALAHALLAVAAAEPGVARAGELRGLHADGTWRWLDVRITDCRDEPDIEGFVVNYRDITERRTLEDELARQAFHDSLSGLANRALFLDRLEHALMTQRQREAGRLAVLFLDLDDFKTVNDGLGHAAGDALLREIGERIRSTMGPSDTCARLGGDEFAILVENLGDGVDLEGLIAHLLDRMQEPVTLEGESIAITASVGVVLSDGDDAAELLVRHADLAMYKAKRDGKARCAVYEPAMHDAAVERLALREDLRRAVGAAELVAHYQPIVDLHTGAVVGAEALARWHHPTRGLLGPDVFIELAEETGLILPIGSAILRQACRDAMTWPDAKGKVCVNVSTRQLQEPALVAEVAVVLDSTGLDPARLTLEITESILIDDPVAATASLEALKALGVTVALDDFGTGFSSLSYLGRFPVDLLKIDKSFTAALAVEVSSSDSVLVEAIIEMSKTLGIEVTAEGVETQRQADRLANLGCTNGQGFLFGRPMSSIDLAELLARPRPATLPPLELVDVPALPH